MQGYNALKLAILADLGRANHATIDNVFSCLVDAENLVRSTMCMVDRTVIDCNLRDARRRLDRAAQHLWGSYPPEGVRVDDNWHYTVTQ